MNTPDMTKATEMSNKQCHVLRIYKPQTVVEGIVSYRSCI